MSESTQASRPIADRIRESLVAGTFITGLCLFAGAVVIVGFQALSYLKSGVWPKWVLMNLIDSVLPTPFIQWLSSPNDWYGLHKVISSILIEVPISVDAVGLAFISILASNMFCEK